MNPDPFSDQPKRWVGLPCRFEHQGRQLVGRIEAHTFAGRTVRGDLPDYSCLIRGESGKALTVSMVETNLQTL
jgi:hypothetical protein